MFESSVEKMCVLLVAISLVCSTVVKARDKDPAPSQEKPIQHKMDEHDLEILRTVEGFRGLRAQEKIQVRALRERKVQKQFDRKLADELSKKKSRDLAEKDGKLFKVLGFIPSWEKYRDSNESNLIGDVTAYTTSDFREIYINENLGEARDEILAHEMAHALAGQNGLEVGNFVGTMDPVLAYTAAIEGHAVFTELSYASSVTEKTVDQLLHENPLPPKKLIEDNLHSRLLGMPPLNPKDGSAPETMRKYFGYIFGRDFIHVTYKTGEINDIGGWELINRVLQTPPPSTAQILHPNGYLKNIMDGQPIEGPENVGWILPETTRSMGKVVVQKSLGEWTAFCLLSLFIDERMDLVAKAVHGWKGDRIYVAETEPSGELSFGWITSWAGPKDALEFLTMYDHRTRMRFGKNYKLLGRGKNPSGNPMFLAENDTLQVHGVIDRESRVLIFEVPKSLNYFGLGLSEPAP